MIKNIRLEARHIASTPEPSPGTPKAINHVFWQTQTMLRVIKIIKTKNETNAERIYDTIPIIICNAKPRHRAFRLKKAIRQYEKHHM